MSKRDERRISVGGDMSGQIAWGDGNNLILNGRAETVNLAELVAFANAVRQALPSLQLDDQREQSAGALVTEIVAAAEDQEPDHGRLRQAGRTLRAIVEGAAANALAAALLTLWKP